MMEEEPGGRHPVTNRRFVDFRRFFRGDVMSLDYAFGVVMDKLKPRGYDKVVASDIPLKDFVLVDKTSPGADD